VLGKNFYPPTLPREARHGVGNGSSLRQQGSKARKNCLFNCPAKGRDCARPLKDVSIFASFACRRQAASRWAGQSAKSSGFCLKKVRISSKTRSHKK